MATTLPNHWCVVCRQAKPLVEGSRLRHSGYEGSYCESCAKDVWDCPECDRDFYIGNMPIRKSGERTKPRHYRNTGKLDGRLREIREVCSGWKSETRLRAEAYYGWSMEVPSAKHQPRSV